MVVILLRLNCFGEKLVTAQRMLHLFTIISPCIAGSRRERHGRTHTPSVKFLLFACSLREKCDQIIGYRPHLWMLSRWMKHFESGGCIFFQILQTGQEIMELDHSSFQTSSSTVHAGNLGDNRYILQVTPHTVSLMEGGGCPCSS